MKSKIILFAVFLCFNVQIIQAQNKNLKATIVVFVVKNKANTITALELFNQQELQVLIKKYPNSKFYLGLLEGEFSIKDNLVYPNTNTSIIVYTNKNELLGDIFLSGDTFLPGDIFKSGHKFFINDIKLQVIERSKSQLVFKTL
jgi:hypothetical protein